VIKVRNRVRRYNNCVNDGEKMIKEKNAFDWNDGIPSIWSRDKELKRLLAGQNWGRQAQAKIGLESKQQVVIYSKAKSST